MVTVYSEAPSDVCHDDTMAGCPTPVGYMRKQGDVAASSKKKLVAFAAGTACQDVSRIGVRMGLLGDSAKTLAVFLAEVRLCKPDIILHECTSEFVREVFTLHLQDYDVYTFMKPGSEAG